MFILEIFSEADVEMTETQSSGNTITSDMEMEITFEEVDWKMKTSPERR